MELDNQLSSYVSPLLVCFEICCLFLCQILVFGKFYFDLIVTLSFLQEVAVKKFLNQDISGESLEEFKSEVQFVCPFLSLFAYFLLIHHQLSPKLKLVRNDEFNISQHYPLHVVLTIPSIWWSNIWNIKPCESSSNSYKDDKLSIVLKIIGKCKFNLFPCGF